MKCLLRSISLLGLLLATATSSRAQWLPVEDVVLDEEQTELGGRCLLIQFSLEGNLSPDKPAFVFIRYRMSPSGNWKLLPKDLLRGDHGIVERPGKKEVRWWGFSEIAFPRWESVEVAVRAIRMARVPAGRFSMKSFPGQGRDQSRSHRPVDWLPLYYMAVNETTIGMYVDYLNEGGIGVGWNPRMESVERSGISVEGEGRYRAAPGREDFPINYVSWYDATGFLNWCGLRLPTEAEFEKAIRGGLYLDGDEARAVKNELPDRRFPWGDELPGAGGAYRCNFDGADDGFEFTAPVGSFAEYSSPYGMNDLVGNLAEWTLDWYTTSHHAGLDGFRLARGGSWMDPAEAVDAISGATQLPVKEASIMGFRGALGE